MRLSIPHPVLARATDKHTGADHIVAGIVSTDVEVEQFDGSEVETAFKDQYSGPILKMGGRLWRRTVIDFDDVARRGLLADSIDIRRETSCILSDFSVELRRQVAKDPGSIIPPPSLSLKNTAAGLPECSKYLRKLGAMERRRTFEIDDEDVERWRNRMREFASGFCIVDGSPYERAHEPLLLVRGKTVTVGTSAIYNRHSNRTVRGADGLPLGDENQLRHDVHVFSFGDEGAAVRLADEASGRPDGGDVRWFNVKCFGTPTAPEAILEQETCRFAGIHISNFHAVNRRWKVALGAATHARIVADTSTELGTYADAARAALAAVLEFHSGSDSFETVRETFDALVSSAMQTEQRCGSEALRRNWESLSRDTDRHLSRLDALPVTLRPAPTWERQSA